MVPGLYAKIMPIRRWVLSTCITELRGNSFNFHDMLNLPIANTPKHQFNVESRFNLTRNSCLPDRDGSTMLRV
jgi:hypothetical protein